MYSRRTALRGSLLVLLIAGLWLASSPVWAQSGRHPGAPVASAPAAIIDLYERTVNAAGQGTPTETGPVVPLPNVGNAGYTVLMDCGDPASLTDRANPDNWSDVLVFPNSGGQQAITVQLLSRGAVFPTYATVTSGAFAFSQELQVGSGSDDADVTTYVGGTNTYLVHSAARNGRLCPIPPPPSQVPEGDTLLLVGTGLAGLAGYASLRWRARRSKNASLQ